MLPAQQRQQNEEQRELKMSETQGAIRSLCGTLIERFPSVMRNGEATQGTTVSHTIGRGLFAVDVAKADAAMAQWSSMLDAMSDDERGAYFRSHVPDDAGVNAPSVDTFEAGGGGDYDLHAAGPATEPRIMTSGDKKFAERASAFALQDLRQIGHISLLLTQTTAVCHECRNPSNGVGVVDMCRSLSGELLCFGCDADRHSKCEVPLRPHALRACFVRTRKL